MTTVPPHPHHRLRTWTLRVLAALLALVLLAAIALVVWSHAGIHQAEPGPLRAAQEDPALRIETTEAAIILRPADGEAPSTGLVFYPGAKVEAEAYIARLSGLVTEDHLSVVIVRPRLHLALFDRRPLATFTDLAPDVQRWIVGGHSMGGVRACQLAPEAQGLLLLGSYCANDLSDRPLAVLSLAGSEDGLSTPQKIADARHLLPGSARLVEIPGAAHASFGDYGEQSGDGTATIDDSRMDATVTAEVGGLTASLP